MSRCDSINYLGPVVKPRDDKFLRFFILRFFYIVIPAQAGIHCAAGICVACARALLITGLPRYARNDKKVVCAGANRRTAVRLFAAVRTAFSPVLIRILAQGIVLPCSVLFATARSPLVNSRLRFACLVYSYANRGSNPNPSRVIKIPA